MSQFRKTVDLWENEGANQDRILSGNLVLQTGQWVQCGPGPKSRFVGVSRGGVFWVSHSEGKAGTGASFRRHLSAFKLQRSRTRNR